MKNTTMKSIILYVHLKRLIHTYLFIMVGTEQEYMPCHRCGGRREHLDVKSLLHHVGFWDPIQGRQLGGDKLSPSLQNKL